MLIDDPQSLAAQEKQVASRLDLGALRWVLVGAVVVYVATLFMPYAAGVPGWRVLTFTEPNDTPVALAERVFTVLSFASLAVCSVIAVAAKRTAAAMLAWMFGCVGLVMALLGTWMRQTGNAGGSTGIGMYVAIVCLVVAVPVLTAAWLRRDPEQARLAQLRRDTPEHNPVADAQARASRAQAEIVDDRRARARQRHGGGDGEATER